MIRSPSHNLFATAFAGWLRHRSRLPAHRLLPSAEKRAGVEVVRDLLRSALCQSSPPDGMRRSPFAVLLNANVFRSVNRGFIAGLRLRGCLRPCQCAGRPKRCRSRPPPRNVRASRRHCGLRQRGNPARASSSSAASGPVCAWSQARESRIATNGRSRFMVFLLHGFTDRHSSRTSRQRGIGVS